MIGRKTFLVVAAVGILVSGYMIVRSLNDNLVYYLFPNEAVAQKESFPDGTPFRLAGSVVPGSIEFDGSDSTFSVTDGSATVEVRLIRTPPPLFGEDVRVLLPGSWQNGIFVATEALVQHDENYTTPEEGNFEESG